MNKSKDLIINQKILLISEHGFLIICTSAVYYAVHFAIGHEGHLIRSNKLNMESITAPWADGNGIVPVLLIRLSH